MKTIPQIIDRNKKLENGKNMKKRTPVELSFAFFLKNFFKDFFHFDSRILRTLKALIFRPGYLTRSYFESTESKYVQPVKLYLIINFIFFLITPLLNTSSFQIFNFQIEKIIDKNENFQNHIARELQKNDESWEIYIERFNTHLKYNAPTFVFLFIPIFALFLKLTHILNKRYYLEHILFSTHLLSFFLLFLATLSILNKLYYNGIISLVSLSGGLFLYVVAAQKNYYRNHILLCAFKSLILMAGFFIAMGGYVQFLFFYTFFIIKLGY